MKRYTITSPAFSVWRGFRDKDTNHLVCNKCKHAHYHFKFMNKEWNGLYSEFPVMIPNPQLTIHYGYATTDKSNTRAA